MIFLLLIKYKMGVLLPAPAAAAAAALREVQQQPGGGGEWWTTTRGSPIIISVPALNGGFSSVSLCTPLIPPSLPSFSLSYCAPHGRRSISPPLPQSSLCSQFLRRSSFMQLWAAAAAAHQPAPGIFTRLSDETLGLLVNSWRLLLMWFGDGRTGCRPVTARQSRDGPPWEN